MIAAISYPVPLDNWETFRSDVDRFAKTWKAHPPGTDDYLLLAMLCRDGLPGEADGLLDGIARTYRRYDGGGCDIGCHLQAADSCGDAFLVCLSTRVYFHREGWLKRLMEAREQNGPGLYGTAVSLEYMPHVRTHCFGIDASLLREYPHRINSRQRGYFFESGVDNEDGSFFNWCRAAKSYPVTIVYWDRICDFEHALMADNRFRYGDQSNLLVFDRHTKLWQDAPPEERERLTKLTYYPNAA